MPELKATTGKPVIVQRKTGYYITGPDSETFADPTGHTWFGKSVALAIARELGGMYFEGSHGTIKQVVTGYLPAATPEAPEDTRPHVQPVLGCTCGGIGAHRRDCIWGGK